MRVPKRLTDNAAKKWKEISKCYDLSNPLDKELVVSYCEQYGLYRRATDYIAAAACLTTTSGKGTIAMPEVAIADKALMAMLKLEKLLSTKLVKATEIGFDL